MPRIPFGLALLAVGLMYLLGLGAGPFLDPPEGFHAAVAESLRASGAWLTLRVDGVRYFDKPPLPYWLMALSFSWAGPGEAAARIWPALSAVGVAAITGRIGVMLGGPRVGLLAGLFVASNLGMFVFGREVKPDLTFILWLTLALAGFAVAYRGAGRWGLAVFYGALGLAALTKDALGALALLFVVALFLWLTRERPYGAWAPWWGALLLLAVALPWYVLTELRNRGFLWYTVMDQHVLNLARQRVFPDEDVPLSALEFLGVNVLAFAPWTLALPWGVARAFKRPWPDAESRLWMLLALWAVLLLGFFTLSPFKLPHYGLPAFPAMALLAARAWDDSIEAAPGAASPRALIVPVCVLFAILAVVFTLAALGRLPLLQGALTKVDVAARNLAARGEAVPHGPLEPYVSAMLKCVIVFGAATIGLALAAYRRWPAVGVGVALAAMIAFMPIVAEGMAQFARSRSVRPIAEALLQRRAPADRVIHEGSLDNSASLLLRMPGPIFLVHGRPSNLAFGATFPDARDIFWDPPRLEAAWAGPDRCFLVSAVTPARSVVRALTPVHLIAQASGRWLYSNRPD